MLDKFWPWKQRKQLEIFEIELDRCRGLLKKATDQIEALKTENSNLRRDVSAQKAQRLVFHEEAVWNMYQFVSGISRPGTYVYFIGNVDEGYVKIGYSNNPEKRVTGVQTGTPFVVSILAVFPGNRDTETILHDRFSHLRTRDRGEWFRIDDEIKLIVSICNQMALEPEETCVPDGHKSLKDLSRERLSSMYLLLLSQVSDMFNEYECTCGGKLPKACPRCRITPVLKMLVRSSHR